MADEELKKLEERIKEVEGHWKFTKVLAGVFGITAAALFAYVTYIKNEASDAAEIVASERIEAVREISSTKNDVLSAVNNKELSATNSLLSQQRKSEDAIRNISKKVLTGQCRTIERAGKCGESWVASCSSDEFVRSVGNHGGKNSCPTNIECCKLGI